MKKTLYVLFFLLLFTSTSLAAFTVTGVKVAPFTWEYYYNSGVPELLSPDCICINFNYTIQSCNPNLPFWTSTCPCGPHPNRACFCPDSYPPPGGLMGQVIFSVDYVDGSSAHWCDSNCPAICDCDGQLGLQGLTNGPGDGDPGPCPVELSSFNTSFANGNAILNWTTQSETNNLGWNIYRGESYNALENDETTTLNFTLITGAGTTTEPTDYQFIDEYPVTEGDTYWYWLETVDGAGGTEYYGPVTLSIPVDEPEPEFPTQTFLFQSYPNPFNIGTNTFIEFSIKEGESATLTIFNVKGQELESQVYEAGSHSFKWNGAKYGSGVYLYKLESKSYSKVKKMLIVK